MQPPKPDPAAAEDAHSDEAEAFIAQEGADGFDGEVIDDLDGEGAPYMPASPADPGCVTVLAAAATAAARHQPRPYSSNSSRSCGPSSPQLHVLALLHLQACRMMQRAVMEMQMVMHLLAPQTHKWRTTLYRTLRDMGVSEEAGAKC